VSVPLMSLSPASVGLSFFRPRRDTLGGINFPTLTFGGVGDGLPENASKFLAGRHVVILADNDKPGRDHAEKKAALASQRPPA
jgi:hypothetical protein